MIKIVGVALTLIVITGLIRLVPPHMAIRDVRPSLPSDDELLALLSIPNKPIKVSQILTSSQLAPGRSIGHHSIVIEWADGKLFVIDAGMDAAHAQEFGKLLEIMWGASPAVLQTTLIDALGAALPHVTGVGFTHLHIDHTQGIAALCAAENDIEVIQTHQQRNIHNFNTTEGADIAATCHQAAAINGDTLFALPAYPGLAMYTLGGHTPGSTLFAVANGSEIFLFPGDTSNSKIDITQNNAKAWWYSYLIVPEDVERTAALREWLKGLDEHPEFTVVVAHDLINVSQALESYVTAEPVD